MAEKALVINVFNKTNDGRLIEVPGIAIYDDTLFLLDSGKIKLSFDDITKMEFWKYIKNMQVKKVASMPLGKMQGISYLELNKEMSLSDIINRKDSNQTCLFKQIQASNVLTKTEKKYIFATASYYSALIRIGKVFSRYNLIDKNCLFFPRELNQDNGVLSVQIDKYQNINSDFLDQLKYDLVNYSELEKVKLISFGSSAYSIDFAHLRDESLKKTILSGIFHNIDLNNKNNLVTITRKLHINTNNLVMLLPILKRKLEAVHINLLELPLEVKDAFCNALLNLDGTDLDNKIQNIVDNYKMMTEDILRLHGQNKSVSKEQFYQHLTESEDYKKCFVEYLNYTPDIASQIKYAFTTSDITDFEEQFKQFKSEVLNPNGTKLKSVYDSFQYKTTEKPCTISYLDNDGMEQKYKIFIKDKKSKHSDLYFPFNFENVKSLEELNEKFLNDNYDIILIPTTQALNRDSDNQEIENENCLILEKGKFNTYYTTKLADLNLINTSIQICPDIEYSNQQLLNKLPAELNMSSFVLDDELNIAKIMIDGQAYYLYQISDTNDTATAFNNLEQVKALENLEKCVLVPELHHTASNENFSPLVYYKISGFGDKEGENTWKNVRYETKQYDGIKFKSLLSGQSYSMQRQVNDKQGIIYKLKGEDGKVRTFRIFYHSAENQENHYLIASNVNDISTNYRNYVLECIDADNMGTKYIVKNFNPVKQKFILEEDPEDYRKQFFNVSTEPKEVDIVNLDDIAIDSENKRMWILGQNICKCDDYGNICPAYCKSTKSLMTDIKNGVKYFVYNEANSTWCELQQKSKTELGLVTTTKVLPGFYVYNIYNISDNIKVQDAGGKKCLYINMDILSGQSDFDNNTFRDYMYTFLNVENLNSIKIKFNNREYLLDKKSMFISNEENIILDTTNLITEILLPEFEYLKNKKSKNLEPLNFYTIDTTNSKLIIDFKKIIPDGLDDTSSKKLILEALLSIKNKTLLKDIKKITIRDSKGQEKTIDVYKDYATDIMKIVYLADNVDALYKIYKHENDSIVDSAVSEINVFISQCQKNTHIKNPSPFVSNSLISQTLLEQLDDIRNNTPKEFKYFYIPYSEILINNSDIDSKTIKDTLLYIKDMDVSANVKEYLLQKIKLYSYQSLKDIYEHLDDIIKNPHLKEIKNNPAIFIKLLQIYDIYCAQNPTKNFEDFLKTAPCSSNDSRVELINNKNNIQNDMQDAIKYIIGDDEFNKHQDNIKELCENFMLDGRLKTMYNFLTQNKEYFHNILNKTDSLDRIDHTTPFLKFLEEYTQLSKDIRKDFEEAISKDKIITSYGPSRVLALLDKIWGKDSYTNVDKENELKENIELIKSIYNRSQKELLNRRFEEIQAKFSRPIYNELINGFYDIAQDADQYWIDKFEEQNEQIANSFRTGNNIMSSILGNDVLYNYMLNLDNKFMTYINIKGEEAVSIPFYIKCFIMSLKQGGKKGEGGTKVAGYIKKIMSETEGAGEGVYQTLCQLLEIDNTHNIGDKLSITDVVKYTSKLEDKNDEVNSNPIKIYIYKRCLDNVVEDITNLYKLGLSKEDLETQKITVFTNAAKRANNICKAFKDINIKFNDDSIDEETKTKYIQGIVDIMDYLESSGVNFEEINRYISSLMEQNNIEELSLGKWNDLMHDFALNLMIFGNTKGTNEGVYVYCPEDQTKLQTKIREELKQYSESKDKTTFTLDETIYDDLKIAYSGKGFLSLSESERKNLSSDYSKIIINGNKIQSFLKDEYSDIFTKKENENLLKLVVECEKLYLTSTIANTLPDETMIEAITKSQDVIEKYLSEESKAIVERISNQSKNKDEAINNFNDFNNTLRCLLYNSRDEEGKTLDTQQILTKNEIYNLKTSDYKKMSFLYQLATSEKEEEKNKKQIAEEILKNNSLLHDIALNPEIDQNTIDNFCTFLDYMTYVEEGSQVIQLLKEEKLTAENIKNISSLTETMKLFQENLFTFTDKQNSKFFDEKSFKEFAKYIDNIVPRVLTYEYNTELFKTEVFRTMYLKENTNISKIISNCMLNCYAASRDVFPTEGSVEDYITNNYSIEEDKLILQDTIQMFSKMKYIDFIFDYDGQLVTFEELPRFKNLNIDSYSFVDLYNYTNLLEKNNIVSYVRNFPDINGMAIQWFNYLQHSINDFSDNKKQLDGTKILGLMTGLLSSESDDTRDAAEKRFLSNDLTKFVSVISGLYNEEFNIYIQNMMLKIVKYSINNHNTEEDIAQCIGDIFSTLNDSYSSKEVSKLLDRYKTYFGDIPFDNSVKDRKHEYQEVFKNITQSKTNFYKLADTYSEALELERKFNVKESTFEDISFSKDQYKSIKFIYDYFNVQGEQRGDLILTSELSSEYLITFDRLGQEQDYSALIKLNKLQIAYYICQQLILNFEDDYNNENPEVYLLLSQIASLDEESLKKLNRECLNNLLTSNGNNKYNDLNTLSEKITEKIHPHELDLSVDIERISYQAIYYLNDLNNDLFESACETIAKDIYGNVRNDAADGDYYLAYDDIHIKQVDALNTIKKMFGSNVGLLCQNSAEDNVFDMYEDIIYIISNNGPDSEVSEKSLRMIECIFSNLGLKFATKLIVAKKNEYIQTDDDGNAIPLSKEQRQDIFYDIYTNYASRITNISDIDIIDKVYNNFVDNGQDIDILQFTDKMLSILEYMPSKVIENKFPDHGPYPSWDYINTYGNLCKIICEKGSVGNIIEMQLIDLYNGHGGFINTWLFEQEIKKSVTKELISELSNEEGQVLPYKYQESINEKLFKIKEKEVQDKFIECMIKNRDSNSHTVNLLNVIRDFDQMCYDTNQQIPNMFEIFDKNIFKDEESVVNHLSRHITQISFKRDQIGDTEGNKFKNIETFTAYNLNSIRDVTKFKYREKEVAFLQRIINDDPDFFTRGNKDELLKDIKDIMYAGLYNNCLTDINNFLEKTHLSGERAIGILKPLKDGTNNFSLLENEPYKKFLFNHYIVQPDEESFINPLMNNATWNIFYTSIPEKIRDDLICSDPAEYNLYQYKINFINNFLRIPRVDDQTILKYINETDVTDIIQNSSSFSDIQKGVLKKVFKKYMTEYVKIGDREDGQSIYCDESQEKHKIILDIIDRISDAGNISELYEQYKNIENFEDENGVENVENFSDFIEEIVDAINNIPMALPVTIGELYTLYDITEENHEEKYNEAIKMIFITEDNKSEEFYNRLVNHGLLNFKSVNKCPLGLYDEVEEVVKGIIPDQDTYNAIISPLPDESKNFIYNSVIDIVEKLHQIAEQELGPKEQIKQISANIGQILQACIAKSNTNEIPDESKVEFITSTLDAIKILINNPRIEMEKLSKDLSTMQDMVTGAYDNQYFNRLECLKQISYFNIDPNVLFQENEAEGGRIFIDQDVIFGMIENALIGIGGPNDSQNSLFTIGFDGAENIDQIISKKWLFDIYGKCGVCMPYQDADTDEEKTKKEKIKLAFVNFIKNSVDSFEGQILPEEKEQMINEVKELLDNYNESMIDSIYYVTKYFLQYNNYNKDLSKSTPINIDYTTLCEFDNNPENQKYLREIYAHSIYQNIFKKTNTPSTSNEIISAMIEEKPDLFKKEKITQFITKHSKLFSEMLYSETESVEECIDYGKSLSKLLDKIDCDDLIMYRLSEICRMHDIKERSIIFNNLIELDKDVITNKLSESNYIDTANYLAISGYNVDNLFLIQKMIADPYQEDARLLSSFTELADDQKVLNDEFITNLINLGFADDVLSRRIHLTKAESVEDIQRMLIYRSIACMLHKISISHSEDENKKAPFSMIYDKAIGIVSNYYDSLENKEEKDRYCTDIYRKYKDILLNDRLPNTTSYMNFLKDYCVINEDYLEGVCDDIEEIDIYINTIEEHKNNAWKTISQAYSNKNHIKGLKKIYDDNNVGEFLYTVNNSERYVLHETYKNFFMEAMPNDIPDNSTEEETAKYNTEIQNISRIIHNIEYNDQIILKGSVITNITNMLKGKNIQDKEAIIKTLSFLPPEKLEYLDFIEPGSDNSKKYINYNEYIKFINFTKYIELHKGEENPDFTELEQLNKNIDKFIGSQLIQESCLNGDKYAFVDNIKIFNKISELAEIRLTRAVNLKESKQIVDLEEWQLTIMEDYINSRLSKIHYSNGRTYRFEGESQEVDNILLKSLATYILENVTNCPVEEQVQKLDASIGILENYSSFDDILNDLKGIFNNEFNLLDTKDYTFYESIFGEEKGRENYVLDINFPDVCDNSIIHNLLLKDDNFNECVDKDHCEILSDYRAIFCLVPSTSYLEKKSQDEETNINTIREQYINKIQGILTEIKDTNDKKSDVLKGIQEYVRNYNIKDDNIDTFIDSLVSADIRGQYVEIFSDETNKEIFIKDPSYISLIKKTNNLALNDDFKKAILLKDLNEEEQRNLENNLTIMQNVKDNLNIMSEMFELGDAIENSNKYEDLKTNFLSNILPNVLNSYIQVPQEGGGVRDFKANEDDANAFEEIKEAISERINTLDDFTKMIMALSEWEEEDLHYDNKSSYYNFNKTIFKDKLAQPLIDINHEEAKKLMNATDYQEFKKDIYNNFYDKIVEGLEVTEKPRKNEYYNFLENIYDKLSKIPACLNSDAFKDFTLSIVPNFSSSEKYINSYRRNQGLLCEKIVEILKQNNAERIIKIIENKIIEDTGDTQVVGDNAKYLKLVSINGLTSQDIDTMNEYIEQFENNNVKSCKNTLHDISNLKKYGFDKAQISLFYPQDSKEFEKKQTQLNTILQLLQLQEKIKNTTERKSTESFEFENMNLAEYKTPEDMIENAYTNIVNDIWNRLVDEDGYKLQDNSQVKNKIKNGFQRIANDSNNLEEKLFNEVLKNVILNSSNISFDDFEEFMAKKLKINKAELELIFNFDYDQGVILRGETKNRELISGQISRELYEKTSDKDKEKRVENATKIINELFDTILIGGAQSKKIKKEYSEYLMAITPGEAVKYDEVKDDIKTITERLAHLESRMDFEKIINGISTVIVECSKSDSGKEQDSEKYKKIIKELAELKDGAESYILFNADEPNVEIIINSRNSYDSLEAVINDCSVLEEYVSDNFKKELILNDSRYQEYEQIFNLCNNIKNELNSNGIYFADEDIQNIQKCDNANEFGESVQKAEINWFLDRVSDEEGQLINKTGSYYAGLLKALMEYKNEDIVELLKYTRDRELSDNLDMFISTILDERQYDIFLPYEESSQIFSQEYIEKQLINHIIDTMEYDEESNQAKNLKEILNTNKTILLDIEHDVINNIYIDFITNISEVNSKMDDELLQNLATLIKKVDDLSNKEDVINSITEILKDEDDKLPKLVKKLSGIEGEDIKSMILKSPEIFTKLIKEDEVTAEQVKSTIEAADKLGIKDKIKGDIDVGDIQQIQTISNAVDIIEKDKIDIDLSAASNTADCIQKYQEAIFDKIAKNILTKNSDSETETIFDLKTKDNSKYISVYNKFLEVFINDEEKLKTIKEETKNFTEKVTFKNLLKKTNTIGNVGGDIIKSITGEDIKFDEILEGCPNLDWNSKDEAVQQSIVDLCRQPNMIKLVDYDGMQFQDTASQTVFVNLVQNIPTTEKEAKTYTQNVETIVDKIDENLLKSVYGETESKPLTVEHAEDLSKNTESINELYTKDEVLTKHLMKKQEKKVDEIKQTATDIHSVIEPANEILMQNICDKNQLDEIVKISKLEKTNGLSNLNKQIKDKINKVETLEEEAKKEIVEVIVDAQLEKLKTEDEKFLQGKDRGTVIKTFKEQILTQPQDVYKEIVNNSEEKFDNTFAGFYRRFCGGGSAVITTDILKGVVLKDEDKKNSLIMDNLDKLTACVNDDFSVKEDSLLSLLQNFTEDNITTLEKLEYEVKSKGKSEKKNALTQLKTAVEEMANNPNALTEDYIKKLKDLPAKLEEYETNDKKNKTIIKEISDNIEYLANKENSYYSADKCERIDNSEKFKRSLKQGKKLSNKALENAIHIISEQTFDSWKSLENKKTREEVFKQLVAIVNNLDEAKNNKSSELLYNFVNKKKDNLKITDISDIKLDSGEEPDQVYAKTLYSVIKKCDNQDEIKDIIGDNKITKTEFQELAKVVAADKKPSKLALDFLTKPDAEIIELEDNDRTDIINTLTDNKNSIIDDFNKYLLLNKLRHDNDYEFMHNDIKTKIETLSSSNPSIATGEIIFTLSDKAAVYDSIIENSKNGIISDDENKCYAAKISSLCESREEIIEIYHEFLDNSYKLCIGDNTKSKDAVVDVIIAACQEEPKLFTEIMTGDTFDEQNKIDFISGKYSPKKINTDIGTATANIIKECIEISTSTNNITDKINNEDIFIAGVNNALKYQEPTKILTICNEINNNINVTNNSIASIESKGHLLGEIFAHQIISSDNLLDIEPFDDKDTVKKKKKIIKELDQANKNIIEKLVSIDNEIYTKETEAEKEHIPSIYKFIESIGDSHKKEEQSKKIANEIISKEIEPAIVVNILSGCKNSDKEEEKSTYNAIISGLASRVTDSNSDYIQNIIKNCLAAEKDDEIKDIAVDLYYQISQRQNNTFEKGHLSSTSIKKLLIDTPLQDRIKDEKSDVYEIMNGGILAKKQERGVSDILNSLKLSPEQIRIYSQQIALLSTPEEIYTLLNDLIKNHNTNVDSDLSTSHIDLLTSTDKKKINAEFKEHDLQAIFTGDSAKEQDSLRDKFYDELQERADELPKNHWYRTGKTRRDAKHRSEIKSVIRNLKEKDIEFRKARDTLNNFTELHIKRAQEAADYIAKYNYYKKIMANEEGKYSQEYIDEAERQFRKMYNKSDYDFMHHGAAKFGGFFRSLWNPLNWFCKRSNRKLYYAQWELKKSNKALRVVAGFEILPQMNDGGDLNYTMNTDFKLKPEDMTIKSKKLRWIEQRQNAGYWAQWHPKYRSIHETEVTRTEDSSVMKKITEEFIEDTSDLRKKGVELLTKKSYHSKSSLGKVEALGNIDVKKAQDVAFNGNKKKEKEKGGASVS